MLGRAPGRAARRLPRHRRPVPDLPHRARRARRLPGGDRRELDRYLPFLATTKVLVAAVQRGVGREVAHEAIKEHAVAVALAMREAGGPGGEELLDRLAGDDRLG